MTERIARMLHAVRSGAHHVYRREVSFQSAETFAGVSPTRRVTERLKEVLAAETPVLLPDEAIVLTRTVKNLPPIFTESEWAEISGSHFIHEQGRVCNLSPDYARVIRNGLDFERQQAVSMLEGADAAQTEFLTCVIESIDAILAFSERYRKAAADAGNEIAADCLSRIPHQGAKTFREALQFFRILHFSLWCEGEYHNTVGRFDLDLLPYFEADRKAGLLDRDSALELLEEFFLTFNRDSDLYPGIQQGDNGQSMMLGGVDADGKAVYSLLSELCLEASRELKVIDPKINLRVNRNTPIAVYETATQLTKAGLGFPQYANDDVVIEGLVRKGYDLEDARNYAVAACWEFIIPKVGMDIPNIAAVNFPKLVGDAVREDLSGAADYDAFYRAFRERLFRECEAISASIHDLYMIPAPLMSLCMDGCIERRRDISLGAKYNNFGFHGVGISTAVDSLAVVKKCIFEEHSLTKAQAVAIVSGAETDDVLLTHLRYEEPKFGDGNALTDDIAVRVFSDFGDAVEPLRNERGGCIRAGTGSAMFYLWCAADVGNALSGHRKGEAFSANYAPELFVKNRGPLSVILSLTKPDLKKVPNGGPVTMEFHSTVFREEDGIRKAAQLVQQFIRHGGHQLQLNSVNRETLLDAQRKPENYKNLIVRVWGWSAYFTELDREYQDHVISRQEFVV
ncbi:pyruvate formate lyase family protein [Yeguia hominis]|uniref:Pyruvate formate-lyase n=1 Tax=Yeguia hominis TaxID=2763662 RepID=A0A926D677_9FIRM|nr:pyruvate formate lyase family protein [Yeguia hominis]MBC8533155.1 pyruvate formate-lyase [Yeguia hominis]